MAATIHTRPPSVSLSKEPIFLTVQTDLVTLNSHAQLIFSFAGTPSENETLELNWLGKKVIFTAKASPSANGTDIPRNGTIAEIAESFFQNEIIAASFSVSFENNQIKLRYRHPSPLSVEIKNTFSNVSPSGVSTFTHTGPKQQPNLRAIVRVEKFDSNDILGTFEVPYDTSTGRAIADIRSAFRFLSIDLPSLNSAILAANTPNMFAKYHIRLADKFGDEPKAESLKIIDSNGNLDSFVTILGQHRGNELGKWAFVTNGGFILHNRPVKNVIVSKNQPQYVYMQFNSVILSNQTIEVDVKLNDGQTVTFQVPFNITNIAQKDKMAWFATGYNHLNLDTLLKTYTLDASKYILEYTWRVKNSTIAIAEAHYIVDRKCYPHEYYFLCENGLGGLETIRLMGLNFEEYQVEREEVERTRWTDSSATEGDIDENNPKGQLLIKCQSALMPISELKRIRQLLLGKIWLCDKINNRWLKVICDTKNIQMPIHGRNTGLINISFKAAWFDYSFNDM